VCGHLARSTSATWTVARPIALRKLRAVTLLPRGCVLCVKLLAVLRLRQLRAGTAEAFIHQRNSTRPPGVMDSTPASSSAVCSRIFGQLIVGSTGTASRLLAMFCWLREIQVSRDLEIKTLLSLAKLLAVVQI